jgi:hypothetical protein
MSGPFGVPLTALDAFSFDPGIAEIGFALRRHCTRQSISIVHVQSIRN